MKKYIAMILMLTGFASADVTVKTIDLLKSQGLKVNGAGPLLVQVDTLRQRLLLANTLTSSITIHDLLNGRTVNLALSSRGFQHLKSEAMTLNNRTGEVALIGDHSFHLIDPQTAGVRSVSTAKQFESIAVDDKSGNIFLAGRESEELAFFQPRRNKWNLLKWTDHEEKLLNLNQSPPPPIRKVIAAQGLGQIIAVDGFTGAISLFRAADGRLLKSFPTPLQPGGRWHLAGYDEKRASLHLVIETTERRVIQAARIEIPSGRTMIAPLPQLTEGVGICYNADRGEIYIPYDNHPTVHVVDFSADSGLAEIKVPTFGNDATAIDRRNHRLYVASWPQGEIDEIDLASRRLIKRILHKGILPHMFNMAFNPGDGLLYIPKGATAVNGSFGAALTVLDPGSEKCTKILTGWAPVDLIKAPDDDGFLVFNNENAYARVHSDGRYSLHLLPVEYPITALLNPDATIYLSYGAHQSYWPVVYIWDARNGLLSIDPRDGATYDRRLPRQAQQMALAGDGTLYLLQNSWGREQQFLGVVKDDIRDFDINDRIPLVDEMERETVPRLLEFDENAVRLYSVRVGEKENDPGLLHIVDPVHKKVTGRIETGVDPSALIFDESRIYIANFTSSTVTVVDKNSLAVETIPVSAQPLRLASVQQQVFALTHAGGTLHNLTSGESFKVPDPGRPDGLFTWKNQLVIAVHDAAALHLYRFDPSSKKWSLLHLEEYPYGDTRFDSGNVSFYLQGQYGDAIFALNQAREDRYGRLWISDFLAGRVYILQQL